MNKSIITITTILLSIVALIGIINTISPESITDTQIKPTSTPFQPIFPSLTTSSSTPIPIITPKPTVTSTISSTPVKIITPVPTSPTPIPTPTQTPQQIVDTNIASSKYTYPQVTKSEALAWFNRIDYLLTNVVIQNPDGSYGGGYAKLEPGSVCKGTHPLTRETSHAVIGYIHAYYATGTTTYKTKAVNGLNYLINEQSANGGFNYYCDNNGYPILYETGIAGRALIEGYQAFGDSRYLTASQKAVTFYKNTGVDSGNANMNGFPITHMVKHYEITKDASVLPTITTFTNAMMVGETSNGYWSDSHNQIYYYQMIMTRSLIHANSALGGSNPTIKNNMYKAVNYIATHQNVDGSLYYRPTTPIMIDEDEDYFSDSITYNPSLNNIVNGLIKYQINRPNTGISSSGMPTNMDWREAFENKPMIAGIMLDYLTKR